jgi:hypothetical protein
MEKALIKRMYECRNFLADLYDQMKGLNIMSETSYLVPQTAKYQ